MSHLLSGRKYKKQMGRKKRMKKITGILNKAFPDSRNDSSNTRLVVPIKHLYIVQWVGGLDKIDAPENFNKKTYFRTLPAAWRYVIPFVWKQFGGNYRWKEPGLLTMQRDGEFHPILEIHEIDSRATLDFAEGKWEFSFDGSA